MPAVSFPVVAHFTMREISSGVSGGVALEHHPGAWSVSGMKDMVVVAEGKFLRWQWARVRIMRTTNVIGRKVVSVGNAKQCAAYF